MKKLILLLMLMLPSTFLLSQTKYSEINKQINSGNFDKAVKMIQDKLKSDSISEEEKYQLNFEIDKMNRIKLDFTKTEDDVKKGLKKYYPNLTERMIDDWVKEKSLEMKVINGKKMFFHNAVPNLFRINKAAKERKAEVDSIPNDKLKTFLKTHIPESVKECLASGKVLSNPVNMDITYTLTVDADAVPSGQMIRCWLPYPKENYARQTNVKLISVNSDEYTVAKDSDPQRTLYLQKPAVKGEPTVFQMKLSYTAYSEWHNIDPAKVKPYDKNSELYKKFTAERPPHIVFSDKIKELSKKIVGDETNPYEKVKKIYTWMNKNIPWASAREYSTIKNISNYCLTNMHGDCGIMTLTFMTLARYNGIPCKWQSGWMMHPGSVNLHDWCEVYFEGYGWVPLDQNFGIQDSDDPHVKYFYIGGIDSYRLIVNDNYGQPLYPEKIYPRSEDNDFQRGEVEWKGGNLYFDKWDYHMDVKYSKPGNLN